MPFHCVQEAVRLQAAIRAREEAEVQLKATVAALSRVQQVRAMLCCAVLRCARCATPRHAAGRRGFEGNRAGMYMGRWIRNLRH